MKRSAQDEFDDFREACAQLWYDLCVGLFLPVALLLDRFTRWLRRR